MNAKNLVLMKKLVENASPGITYVSYRTHCPLCSKNGRKSKLRVTTKRVCESVEIRFMKCSCRYCFGSIFPFKVVS